MRGHRKCFTSAVALILFWMSSPLLAATSLLIWPLDPTIEAGHKAGALWLENVGKVPVTLQIRVFAWEQRDFEDQYAEQGVIVGTPPFTTIAPGKKQLVRLTLTQPIPAGEERAFRVLVDEIPANSAAPSTGLRLQMRYSLPLFAYGQGLWGKAQGRRSGAEEAQPTLAWRFVEEDGMRYVQVRNSGKGHARLSRVSLIESSDAKPHGEARDVAKGLLGYVLPGQTMRWPVSVESKVGSQLQAQLETNAPLVMLPNE